MSAKSSPQEPTKKAVEYVEQALPARHSTSASRLRRLVSISASATCSVVRLLAPENPRGARTL